MIDTGCLIYTNKSGPPWSALTGREDCDRVKDALDELYAKIDGILKTISLESLTDQSCIDFVPTGDELTATDVLCHIWQGLDEAEILIGELEALSGAWDGDSCRRG